MAPANDTDPPTNPIWTLDNISPPYVTPLSYAGNPNGNVAGTVGPPPDLLWDSSDKILYICTTTGNAANAVWTPVFPASGSYQLYITATGANNWSAPFNGSILVEAWSGGGGSSGSSSGVNAICGAGSGAYASLVQNVVSGTSYPYVVGAGGTVAAYGQTGGTGGTTTWNNVISITGGTGSSLSSVGSGGGATGGTINLVGTPGTPFGSTTGTGGTGGMAPRGSGGGSSGTGGASAGNQPGGGAGGPGGGATNPGQLGGAGAILITRVG